MRFTRTIGISLFFTACLLLAAPRAAFTQDSPDNTPVKHGRKYKPPPATSHIEVLVTRKSNGKPIPNAAVIFNPSKDGKDEGSLEVKTDPEGKAIVDVIPTGSLVRVQILANGFATYADDYLVSEPTKQIAVQMVTPRAQISAYQDNQGKASDRKPGVQDDPTTSQRPKAPDTKPAATPDSAKPATPDASTPAAPSDAPKQQ
jgi:hypothetical protein